MIVAPLWIENHKNVGTLARTCEALGADLVVPATFRREVRNGNTVKYPALYLEPTEIKRWVRHVTFNRHVVAVETGGKPLGDFTPDRDVVLILGSEGIGTPQWALDLIEDVATIPQVGQGPCLNLAVAGSIAAYHFAGVLA